MIRPEGRERRTVGEELQGVLPKGGVKWHLDLERKGALIGQTDWDRLSHLISRPPPNRDLGSGDGREGERRRGRVLGSDIALEVDRVSGLVETAVGDELRHVGRPRGGGA